MRLAVLLAQALDRGAGQIVGVTVIIGRGRGGLNRRRGRSSRRGGGLGNGLRRRWRGRVLGGSARGLGWLGLGRLGLRRLGRGLLGFGRRRFRRLELAGPFRGRLLDHRALGDALGGDAVLGDAGNIGSRPIRFGV